MKICVPLSPTEGRCLCQSGELEYGDNRLCSSCELGGREGGKGGVRKRGGDDPGSTPVTHTSSGIPMVMIS